MNMPRILFVDDEPHIIQSLRRALHSTSREWQLHFAGSGSEALDLMQRAAAADQPIDLIVSDMRMPEMNGAELLQQVSRRFPSTIRFILSGHSDQDLLLHVIGSTHQFLSKPCEVDVLKQAIKRAFVLRRSLKSAAIVKVLANVRTLPTPGPLYQSICEALQRPMASLEQIGELIAQDPTISSQILHLANSAFFGLPQIIANVPEAVIFLGIQVVRAVVMTASLFESHSPGSSIGRFVQAVQEHSLQVAGLARHLCIQLDGSGRLAEECFIAGLLHDLGKLLLLQYPPYFPELPIEARRQGIPLYAHEMQLIECHHGSIGGYILGLWGLPDSVVEAVLFHHHPDQAVGNRLRPLVAVHLANTFVHEMSSPENSLPYSGLDETLLSSVNLTARTEYLRAAARDFFGNTGAAV